MLILILWKKSSHTSGYWCFYKNGEKTKQKKANCVNYGTGGMSAMICPNICFFGLTYILNIVWGF
jgi:hypothetical protein